MNSLTRTANTGGGWLRQHLLFRFLVPPRGSTPPPETPHLDDGHRHRVIEALPHSFTASPGTSLGFASRPPWPTLSRLYSRESRLAAFRRSAEFEVVESNLAHAIGQRFENPVDDGIRLSSRAEQPAPFANSLRHSKSGRATEPHRKNNHDPARTFPGLQAAGQGLHMRPSSAA